MLNPHNPSRNEKNAQKLKQNEFLPVMRALKDSEKRKWVFMGLI